MNKKYIVTLVADERAYLHQTIAAGKGAARKLLHARILLKADASPVRLRQQGASIGPFACSPTDWSNWALSNASDAKRYAKY